MKKAINSRPVTTVSRRKIAMNAVLKRLRERVVGDCQVSTRYILIKTRNKKKQAHGGNRLLFG
jgi:hypothetical protein